MIETLIVGVLAFGAGYLSALAERRERKGHGRISDERWTRIGGRR